MRLHAFGHVLRGQSWAAEEDQRSGYQARRQGALVHELGERAEPSGELRRCSFRGPVPSKGRRCEVPRVLFAQLRLHGIVQILTKMVQPSGRPPLQLPVLGLQDHAPAPDLRHVSFQHHVALRQTSHVAIDQVPSVTAVLLMTRKLRSHLQTQRDLRAKLWPGCRRAPGIHSVCREAPNLEVWQHEVGGLHGDCLRQRPLRSGLPDVVFVWARRPRDGLHAIADFLLNGCLVSPFQPAQLHGHGLGRLLVHLRQLLLHVLFHARAHRRHGASDARRVSTAPEGRPTEGGGTWAALPGRR
mmetsp:Transcript_82506/g.209807  ORF Transcript_82506/g.209807 Transcript_82506/m.209807 type:complete len:299 (-) Transcript_82506:44-940(-)